LALTFFFLSLEHGIYLLFPLCAASCGRCGPQSVRGNAQKAFPE
jgi:hypothetical protein